MRGAAVGIANFFDGGQRFEHHRIVLGVQRLDQIRDGRASPQNADGPGGVGARVRAGSLS